MAKKAAPAMRPVARNPRVRDEVPVPVPELAIATDKVCYFIQKAREFEAKDAVTEPDPGSNGSDDQMISVLEDHGDDPVQQELSSLVADMSEDEKAELVALAWLGRGDGGIEDWPSLRGEALRVDAAQRAKTARYLLGMPLVSEYLEEALALFGRSCEDEV